jgi:preprotein translocase subunit SecG
MYTLALILILVCCVLLIIIVLVQNSKGGGLVSGFSMGNQFGGVAQTNKFLVRATWTLAIALCFFCIVGTLSINSQPAEEKESDLQDLIENYDYSVPTKVPVDITTDEASKDQETDDNK